MQLAANQSTAKSRGIIVVDACALVNLCSPVPDRFYTPKGKLQQDPPVLGDMLFYLAEHGYEVIIPEMVSYEAASCLRDGKSLNKYFDSQSKHHFLSITTEFFKKYRATAHNNLPIRIQPPLPDDFSHDAKYLNLLYAIHSDPTLSDTAKSQHITHTAKISKPPKDAGERAALKIIKTLRDPTVPVFFLSDDEIAYTAMAHDADTPPMNILGSGGLFNAFQKQHLLPKIGIKNADFHDIGRHIQRPSLARAQTFAGTVSQIDVAKGQDKKDVAHMPFSESIAELKKVLDAAPLAPTEQPDMTVESAIKEGIIKSPLDKWKARYSGK